MNWRWLLWDYCDPNLPLSRWQRLRVFLRPVRIGDLPRGALLGRIWFALSMFGSGVLALLIMIWFTASVWGRLSLRAFLVWFALMTMLTWIVGSLAYGAFCRRENYHRLRLDGHDVCASCGYWLRGLGDDSTKCPECGAEREVMPEVKA